MNLRLLLSAAIVLLFGSHFLLAQAPQNAGPPLLPLNDAEKKIDPKQILLNQPDFTATENYFSARQISGFSVARKVARKGKQYRFDTGMVVFILELEKPTIKLNGDRTYDEGVGNFTPFVSATNPLNPADLLAFSDLGLEAVGAVDLDGARLLKIKATSKQFTQEVFLYADLAKKNLITAVQVIGPDRWGMQRLIDVSFDVPAGLFDLTGYKARPKFTWKKVENAKVILRGKPVEEGLVFRHGDYLFVHAGEFEHFFIDVKAKQSMNVIYRGTLLAKNGAYIWRTKESEAISIGEPGDNMRGDDKYRVSIQATANTLIVPDQNDKKSTLLKIEW